MMNFTFWKTILIAAALMVVSVSANAQPSLSEGLDMVRDGKFGEAREIFAQLATAGEPEAMYHLAAMNHSGAGGGADIAEAVHWYQEAAKAGVAEAKFALGSLYYKGKGVPEDLARALVLFTDAAEAGVMAAQYNLAMMHASGFAHTEDYGAQEDKPRAFKWFTIVLGRLDDPDDRAVVEENFAFLKKQMEADEIAAGEALVDEWLSAHSEVETTQ